jgi:hypothetical protein
MNVSSRHHMFPTPGLLIQGADALSPSRSPCTGITDQWRFISAYDKTHDRPSTLAHAGELTQPVGASTGSVMRSAVQEALV